MPPGHCRGARRAPRPGGLTSGLRRYARSFTGFERDARIFLAASLVYGVGLSLYWIDFNLYLAALGFDRAFIGIVAAAGSLAGALAAFPASMLSDRVGRRLVLLGACAVGSLALAGMLVAREPLAIVALVVALGAANQAFGVLVAPFLAEHSHPENRSELFSLQFAISNITNIGAALAGGAIAALAASLGGLGEGSPEAYRILLAVMVGSSILGTATIALLRDDRPGRRRDRRSLEQRPGDGATGEPLAARGNGERVRARSPWGTLPAPRDRALFLRLLIPGFLISLGAGQVIPFLNLFIEGKFGLDLASLNVVFAFTSLGTTIAILVQPALARRYGKVASVVLVQAASIPFLVVLGFSPILWTVMLAMAVRNSLMNAGNPIQNAFAMEQLPPGERATFSAASSLLWSLGWVIAGPWYSVLQATLGFGGGYAVNFVTIIVLYSVATYLYWAWFRGVERPVTPVEVPAS